MMQLMGFLDSLSVIGLLVSLWLLWYSLRKDRRYYTADNSKFYVENPMRNKYIVSAVVCVSWIISRIWVAA